MIDTVIAREERNRYLEAERKIREQKEAEKERWERELQEGADYLRREINKHYLV